MKHGWPYSLLHGIAVLLTLGGAVGLLSHFAGQFQKGSASELSLFGGLGLLVLGIVLLILADLGTRLVRIETKLGTLPSDDFAESDRPPPDPGPAPGSPAAPLGGPKTRFYG